jgi:hypothetical protein
MRFHFRIPIHSSPALTVFFIMLFECRQGQCANSNGELYRVKEAKDGNVNGDSEPDVRSQYIHNLIQNDHLPNAGPEEVATPDGEVF